jgi:large subunit ribosomal protein L35
MSAKAKTHKGALKRFKVTATGKVRYRRSFAGHLMSAKTGKRRRQARRPCYVHPRLEKKIRQEIDR